jgi:FkbH-like protein/FkbM family methyltransferase
VEYTFYEAGADDGSTGSAAEPYAAKVEIDRNQSTTLEADNDAFSIEGFRAQSHTVIDSEQFYKELYINGNQYGPHFQNVSSVWRAGDHVLGRLSVTRELTEIEPHSLDPTLLDSITQLLTPFVTENNKSFLLRSIAKVEVADFNFPDTLWGHASLLPQEAGDQKHLVGNVRVFDQSGKQYLVLSGVAFSPVDHDDVATENTAGNFLIAANFTADPVADSLKFWSNHFDAPVNIEFAAYNQIFQQLLDTESAFRRNSDGVNAILLRLDEWAVGGRHALVDVDRKRAEQCFADRPRYILPNGLEIVHLNQYETAYVYKEIFEDQCYLRHGIRLRDGATVVDIGANIGLFSLFVMSHCANPEIYAFEPAPLVYDLLKQNCTAHGSNVHAFNLGVSDKPKTATFTFYEKSSVFSGFNPNESEDREAIQTVVRNMLNRELSMGDSVEEYVSELTANRFGYQTHECRVTSISDIIRENQINEIDLLKIDAEKSELDIINGIEDSDWPKIDQIVIEIHDKTGEAVKRIEELLRDKGYHCIVEHEKLLEHSGLFNLYATRREAASDRRSDSGAAELLSTGISQAGPTNIGLQRNVEDFCAALRSFMNGSTAPLVLCLCPMSPNVEIDRELKGALNKAERTLLSEAAEIQNVHTISAASLLQYYPVADCYDPHTARMGVPYTPECYAAIGTALARAIFNLNREPYKVIVLDCDNTLWNGVCGEDGLSGIKVTQPYRALQDFMIGQMNAGMLLCLCSKNNEHDVLEVFDHCNDMRLKREHLVSWRINWKSKSENIKSLANELNLGLDSFIFIDDSPLDCADVKINCPGVLTLQLPRDTGSIPSFLNHVWAFDRAAPTEEDQCRTQMYRENAKRQHYLEQALSLKDFVKGLELRVEIREATNDQLSRISQQTFRTNQFNFTTIRRSESEIKQFLKNENTACVVARVVDRFGDYGLVGVLMYGTEAEQYKVDTFLLSCRVLGRGVEHVLVSWLGRCAVEEGKRFVEFDYLPTGKNVPALEFITSIGDQYRNQAGTSWVIPAEYLARVEYDPDENAIRHEIPAPAPPKKLTPHSALSFGIAHRSEHLQKIGEHLYDISRLTTAIEEYRLRKQSWQPAADASAGDALETSVANIWKKVLGRVQIGINDNFFEAGGTSLKAVQVLALIRKELQQSLSIVTLFECPTVKLLAAKLTASSAAHGETPTAAALRGQQRRYNARRERAS